LTLLAVAKGRFPLVEKDTSGGGGKDDSPKYKQAAGGRLCILVSICDGDNDDNDDGDNDDDDDGDNDDDDE